MSAPILARRGEGARAVELAQEAVELLRKSEATLLEADALAELASVFDLLGRSEDALSSAKDAARLYRMKGDVVATERMAGRGGPSVREDRSGYSDLPATVPPRRTQ
jgi:hypothetical protein